MKKQLSANHQQLEHIYQFINSKLQQREENNSRRYLSHNTNLIDFCSNDYLGFARSEQLKLEVENALKTYPSYHLGTGGSRLLAGNSAFIEELENEIAQFHQAKSGLIFNSGYDANLGLFSSLPQKGDTIITDELIHACIIDGARLSLANRYTFKHNDLNSLAEKLKVAKGNIFIAVESVYSMDGDEAPLAEIVELAQQYNANLIVDEAHATGIIGPNGSGKVVESKLQDKIFARVITFGKALGSHGAIVLGKPELRDYLINFARSFIYTTASSFHTNLTTMVAYRYLKQNNHQNAINQKINLFTSLTNKINLNSIASRTAIQSILIPGNDQARNMAKAIQDEGIDVRAILSPTVTSGKERLRICLHSYNTDQQIHQLVNLLQKQAN